MPNIFVISDTHFNHLNIIKYCNRPFENTKDMDWTMVERWNSVVKPDDLVYHLGDVYMKASKGYIENILSNLNGRKRLILGNHDNGKDQTLQRYFEKIELWKIFPHDGLMFTHIPVNEMNLKVHKNDDGTIMTFKNIHGHIHQNDSPSGPYRNVSVEQINYTPIAFEELK